MGKNHKHMLEYQEGSVTITEPLSNNNTSFVIQYNSQTYYRNIIHMSNYTSTKTPSTNVQIHIDNSHNVRIYVAVLDRLGNNHYHLAKS